MSVRATGSHAVVRATTEQPSAPAVQPTIETVTAEGLRQVVAAVVAELRPAPAYLRAFAAETSQAAGATAPASQAVPALSRWPLVALATVLCVTALVLAWLNYGSQRDELDRLRADKSAKQAADEAAEKQAHSDRHDRQEASSRAGWRRLDAMEGVLRWIMDAQQRVYEQAGGKGDVLPRPPPDTITQATDGQAMAPVQ